MTSSFDLFKCADPFIGALMPMCTDASEKGFVQLKRSRESSRWMVAYITLLLYRFVTIIGLLLFLASFWRRAA